ncbi:unnamed protein product, partial [Allacma fusca]
VEEVGNFTTTVLTSLNSTEAPVPESMARPEYAPGDITWVLASTTLVCLMTPGLGFFYSGMAKSKNALHILILCLCSLVIVSIQVGFLIVYKN